MQPFISEVVNGKAIGLTNKPQKWEAKPNLNDRNEVIRAIFNAHQHVPLREKHKYLLIGLFISSAIYVSLILLIII